MEHTQHNTLFDDVRGVTKMLIQMELVVIVQMQMVYLLLIVMDLVGTRGDINGASTQYASWNWKASMVQQHQIQMAQ